MNIDEQLLTKAMALSDSATKRETVQRALEELIRACRRRELKALAGSGIVDMTLPALHRARRRGQVRARRVR